MAFSSRFENRRVLVTGHTGFKGSWLSEWLLALGAEVTGLALPPEKQSHFTRLDLASRMRSFEIDIRDAQAVARTISETRPAFVFHLAAQPLVRQSYEKPVDTYATNVMGTAHVLEALRIAGNRCITVIITTDKCYDNKEWVHSYREEDPMGGHDPYSSSKGAAEILINSYRKSYFSSPDSPVRLASARAGNVIGGGDWATDRIVPDCVRSLQNGQSIGVRNPRATRPWQHVLEPLSGYLWLAARLDAVETQDHVSRPPRLDSAFNFGPAIESNRSVSDLVTEILKHWPGTWRDDSDPAAVHEATLLNLATDKAYHHLGWRPVWDFPETIARTITWYRTIFERPGTEKELTQTQIAAYQSAAENQFLPWSI